MNKLIISDVKFNLIQSVSIETSSTLYHCKKCKTYISNKEPLNFNCTKCKSKKFIKKTYLVDEQKFLPNNNTLWNEMHK